MKISRGRIIQYALASVLVFMPLLANMTVADNDAFWLYDLGVFLGFWAVFMVGMLCLRFSMWWLTPIILLSLVYSCFVWQAGYGVSYHVISAIYDTNFNEAKEFLISPIILPGAVVLVLLFVAIMYCLNHKWKWQWTLMPTIVSRGQLITIVMVGVACLTTWKVLGNDFLDVYPAKLVSQNIDYFNEVYLIRKEYKKVEYVYKGAPVGTKPETYIFVIGESARKMNWGLYGYERPTTPEVRKWIKQYPDNTVLFTRAIASGRVTRVSVPLSLSVCNAKEYSEFFRHPSILRVFRAAGYKTFVASAQAPTGYYEGLANMVFSDADVVTHLRDRDIYYPLDEQILPVLDEFINDQAPKKLIILHLQGSHLEYAKRYPDAFDHFHGKGEQMDAYDNSICYTDWVIRGIFERVEELDFPATVFYMSDHGENLNDSGDGNFSHGVKDINRYEISLPMVCYFNGQFADRRPRLAEAMRKHKDNLVTHDMIAHTFMGMARLDDPSVYRQAYDLSSLKFNPTAMYFADNMHTLIPLSKLLSRTGVE